MKHVFMTYQQFYFSQTRNSVFNRRPFEVGASLRSTLCINTKILRDDLRSLEKNSENTEME
jgi:hypothetical protein